MTNGGTFSDTDPRGLEDFWQVYDARYEEIRTETLRFAVTHAEFGPLVRALTPEQLAAQSGRSRELMRRAVAGDAAAFVEDLRVQGQAYARMGVSLRGWHQLVRAFTQHLVPLLVAEFGAEPPRLARAVTSMVDFIDDVMVWIAEGYLETKEALVRAQRAALREAEQPGRFFALSPDLLCIAGVDGHFKRVNPAFKVLGYTEEELLARPFLDFVHPDDRAATIAEVEKLARGVPSIEFQNRYRCKDGTYRDLLWSTAPDESGMLFAAARDITERKQTQAKLETAHAELGLLNARLEERNAELQRAVKAKSDFLAMMSHELRTPLNSVIGFSEVLIDGKVGPLNERQVRYLTNVHGSGRHLLGLINDLLDLSKIEAGRLEVAIRPCSTRLIVGEALSTLQPVADAADVVLEVAAESAQPHEGVAADPVRFKQVLYNLLSNAIKFSPKGGVVVVRTTTRDQRVRISVSDSGPGIAADDVPRLFRPFNQLENAREKGGGTGLGLALTKELVELMHGEIGVESVPGAGSTFFVELPRVEPAAPAPEAGAHAGREDAPLVLIVDDDKEAQELLVLTLQGAGYRTVVASTGEAAIALARSARPHAITLDVFLPSIAGWDVLRVLRNDPTTAGIPIVMVTISSDRGTAFTLGAVEHLVKPIENASLLAALSRLSFTTKVRHRPVHVLVVDDDPTQLELARAALEPHGFHVRTEASGRTGLDAALSAPADLLLLDLVMPDMSGMEVIEALRRGGSKLPIILITGQDLTATVRAQLEGEVQAIVAKSALTTAGLLEHIDSVLREGR
jgi:PAS domain S-box-containing protein